MNRKVYCRPLTFCEYLTLPARCQPVYKLRVQGDDLCRQCAGYLTYSGGYCSCSVWATIPRAHVPHVFVAQSVPGIPVCVVPLSHQSADCENMLSSLDIHPRYATIYMNKPHRRRFLTMINSSLWTKTRIVCTSTVKLGACPNRFILQGKVACKCNSICI